MTDQFSSPPVDLSPLDPLGDGARFDGVVASVVRRAGAELARRRQAGDVLLMLARWTRPVLVAAALLLAVSVAALERLGVQPSSETASTIADAPTALAEAAGVPPALAGFENGAPLPGPGQLLYGSEDVRPGLPGSGGGR